MKYVIASDIHGSGYYVSKLLGICNKESAEKLILLGDIYNHGPRNPLPKDYNPMYVAELLNTVKDYLIVIKGNCDSEVDTMISEFTFTENAVVCENGKSLFLTHGHVYNKDNMPKSKFDAVVYGHFHTGFIEKIDGVVVANAGSISIPKGDTPASYIVFDKGELTLKDLDGNELSKIQL